MATDIQIVEDNLKRHAQLKEDRKPWLSMWQDIADYVIPLREDLLGNDPKGKLQGQRRYDGTATSAHQLFGDGFHGHLVSPAMKWFVLRLRDKELMALPEVRQWLQEVSEQIYFALQESNYYGTMRMCIDDGTSFGTATKFREEDMGSGRLIFTSMHPGQIVIAEDKFGFVDTTFREFKMTGRQIVQRFGEKVLPDQTKDSIKLNPYQKLTVLHAVYPREDRDVTKLDVTNKKFASNWILTGAQKHEALLSNSGFDSDPFNTWRFKKSGREVYGRSPASDALSDIIGLNKMDKTMLAAAQLSVEPPVNVPANRKGQVRLVPRGINYFEKGEDPISPINMGIKYPIGVDRQERKQKIIEEHFKVDFFLLLARSERQMTATEILERQGEKAAVLGATVGRFGSEVLDDDIDWVFDAETRAGRLPEPPAVLEERGGEPIDIIYMGPLAQAQRILFETRGINLGLEAIAQMAELDPTVLDNINFDAAARAKLEATGFPQDAIRDVQDVQALRQARQQALAEEQAKDDAERSAEGVKTLAQADQASGGQLSAAISEAQ